MLFLRSKRVMKLRGLRTFGRLYGISAKGVGRPFCDFLCALLQVNLLLNKSTPKNKCLLT